MSGAAAASAGGGGKPSGASAGYIELLRRNRNFRQLWLGQVVSQLGDWFNTIALFTLVLELTGSGGAVGLVLVARFLPSVVIGPLSGVIADRFDRRRVMIVSDVLRAVVVLGFLFVRRPDQLWMVYALTILQLALSTFFEPAKTAAVPSIVTARELVPANAISSVTWSAMLTLGAAIGGPVTGLFGTDAAFVLDSLTYLVSAALIWRVRLPERVARAAGKSAPGGVFGIGETAAAVGYVMKRPRVLALLLVKPAWGVGGGILTLLPVFGEKIYPVGGKAATGIGVLYAARGIGTAVGPVAARLLAGDTGPAMQTAIGLAFLTGGLFYIAFGYVTNFVLALLVLAVAHMGGSVLWVYSTVLLQGAVADEFRGRVFAAELVLLTLTMAASNYVTGQMLDRLSYSPRAVSVSIGVLFLAPGVLWFVTRRWWSNREEPVGPTPLDGG